MSSRQKDYLYFREIHDKFIYEKYSYSINDKEINISFNFILESNSPKELTPVVFSPKLQIPLISFSDIDKLNPQLLDNLIFHMGMVELISYWKAACPSVLIIKPLHLNDEQISFWKKLYWNGLGEFFYVNGIDTSLEEFVQIQSDSSNSIETVSIATESKILIPIGGGKDSAVSLELLKDTSLELFPFIINPRGASLNTVKQAELSKKNLLLAKRSIDPTLLKLNKQGYLNGHTPFSAMLAFTTLLQAYVAKAKYIALSNESSANEPSVADSHVNHQYSKTFEFESDFRAYYKKYITTDIEYFSFLRPLSELQIACLFSKSENHHFSFRSCNVGSKTDSWCGNCPKCQFTYIMLAPFLPEKKLNAMLGENLIIKPSLEKSLAELRGLTKVKPFECVGTVDEVNLALNQAFSNNNYPKPDTFKGLVFDENKQLFTNALKDWNPEHFLPKSLEKLLKEKLSLC